MDLSILAVYWFTKYISCHITIVNENTCDMC